MPKRYSAKEVINGLKRLGFIKVSQQGSHIKFRGLIEAKLQTVIVPNHKQIAVGTFSSIFRQANVSKHTLEEAIG